MEHAETVAMFCQADIEKSYALVELFGERGCLGYEHIRT
jgi:hypothetical protein